MVDWTNSKIIGMQCMQELFFRLCELRWDIVLVMSSFLLKKKSLNLNKNENNALVKLKDRKKKFLFVWNKLTRSYFVVHCLCGLSN